MGAALSNYDSLLMLDVGTITTRAMLFDLVKDRYRLIAASSSRTTAGAPYSNVMEGVISAVDGVQKVTGRTLVGKDQNLIKPSLEFGSGVDACVATISAGPPVKVCLVGLLEDVSLESARRLASTVGCKVVQSISLNDRQRPEARIDAFLQARPDLVIVAGGTDSGASQSVMKLLESVGLACYLMPEGQRPVMLFAGNQELKEEVKANLSSLVELHFAENIRPTLDIQQLGAAQAILASIYCNIRNRQINGVSELSSWLNGDLLPTSAGIGRVVRFLSKANDSKKGVLGVDVGAASTSIASAIEGELRLGVYPEYGLGGSVGEILEHCKVSEFKSWMLDEFSEDQLGEYLFAKSNHPASLPVTEGDLLLEHTLARLVLRKAVKSTFETTSGQAEGHWEELLPWMEPLIASGSVLTKAPSLGHCLLLLLDSVQPTGVAPILLDSYHLVSGLGTAAAVNPLFAIQILDSNALIHLGTVISPVGTARPGTPILRIKLTYENGQDSSLDIKYGSLEALPLPHGKSVRLHLQPLHNFDIGMGAPGRGGTLRQVAGGTLGLVIDARGRPFTPPADLRRRQELYRKWLWALGTH